MCFDAIQINCEFSLMFVVIKVKKNRCVDCWKLWHIMWVNRIMSWKIMDVKIWFDCTSYASWLCEEKEKNWRNGCAKWKLEWPRRGQKNEKKNEKWNDPKEGELRRKWDP